MLPKLLCLRKYTQCYATLLSISQKSSKRLSELRELSEPYVKVVPKPSKAKGTRWIDYKYRAMELFFAHFGPYMSHLEQLTQTDLQALKWAEICGLVKKWKNANFIINIAIYLDVLVPIKCLAVSLQEEVHNPVKAFRKSNMTYFTLLMLKIEVKEGKHHYQGIKLSK